MYSVIHRKYRILHMSSQQKYVAKIISIVANILYFSRRQNVVWRPNGHPLQWKFDLCSPRKESVHPQSQSPHSCLCEQFIYSHLFPAAEKADRPWEYINRSQKHECRNWDWCRAVSFLGIFISNFLYAVFALPSPSHPLYPCTFLMYNDDRNTFVLLMHTFCQVGSISQNWDGVLKTIVAKADRFSIDFPPNIGKRGSGERNSA